MKKKKMAKSGIKLIPDFPERGLVHTNDPEDPIDISKDDPEIMPFEDPFETPEYEEPPEGEGP